MSFENNSEEFMGKSCIEIGHTVMVQYVVSAEFEAKFPAVILAS